MLRFSGDLDCGKRRYFELSDSKLEELVKNGEKLYVKGGNDEELIVCSEDHTFRVREVHTSNLQLLVSGNTVTEMATSFLEAKRIPGKLVKLKEWLEACPYEGPDEEPQPEALERLRMGVLFGNVQASDCEIRNFLSDINAILINGCYRLVSAGYLCRFFKMLFALLTMNDLCSCSVLDKSIVMRLFASESEPKPESEVEEFPPNIVGHLLLAYMDSIGQLDQRKIGRFFAEELLKARPVWIESEFLSAWRQLLGDLPFSLDYLGDLILKEPVPGITEARLAYFPASRLPLEPESRFARLFETRTRWQLNDIEPFVEGAARAFGVELLDLLVKHARISTDSNGARIVTALLSV